MMHFYLRFLFIFFISIFFFGFNSNKALSFSISDFFYNPKPIITFYEDFSVFKESVVNHATAPVFPYLPKNSKNIYTVFSGFDDLVTANYEFSGEFDSRFLSATYLEIKDENLAANLVKYMQECTFQLSVELPVKAYKSRNIDDWSGVSFLLVNHDNKHAWHLYTAFEPLDRPMEPVCPGELNVREFYQ